MGWYKKHNSDGIIIAIDLVMPNYLGKNDYFVEGDMQKIILQMYTKIMRYERVLPAVIPEPDEGYIFKAFLLF